MTIKTLEEKPCKCGNPNCVINKRVEEDLELIVRGN
jgi:hypothetical protein